MELSSQQQQAILNGQPVQVDVSGTPCIMIRKDVYEKDESLDLSPWTPEEMDLLAAEAADLLAGDGLDEPDDA
jgi:hypothetical protein